MNSNGTFQRKDCAKLLRYLKQQDVKKNLPKAATIQQQCQHNEKIVDKRKKSSRTQKIYGTSSHIDKIGKEFSNSGKRLRQSNKQTNRKVQLDNDIQLKQDVQNLLKKLNDNVGDEELDSDIEIDNELVDDHSENLVDDRSSQLAVKAKQTLALSMFRSLNEYLYTHSSYETKKQFNQNKFQLYHQAYERLLQQWPVKPVDFLIDILKKRAKTEDKLKQLIIADVGCGNRPQISLALKNATVYSFDLYSTSEDIISADMCALPVDSSHCDYAIYSLSLMPVNLRDAIMEANRILKIGGYLLIVEVASRFVDYQSKHSANITEKHPGHNFANDLRQSYGFQLTRHELLPPNGYFIYFSFKKLSNVNEESKSKLPLLTLKACVYKSR